MKSDLKFSTAPFVALFATLLLVSTAAAWANPSPLLGETISIKGATYSCVITADGTSDYDTSNDGMFQYANYYAGDAMVSIKCMIGGAGLATVNGTYINSDGNADGVDGYYYIGGEYNDKTQLSDVEMALNGNVYTYKGTIYLPDLDSGTVSWEGTVYHGTNGTNDDVTFTVHPDGTVSGSENGFYYESNFYLDNTSTSAVNLTLSNGHYYNSMITYTTFSLENGQPIAHSSYSYIGNNIGFNVDLNGTLSGSENGCFYNGAYYLNSSSSTAINLTLSNGHTYTSKATNKNYSFGEDGQPYFYYTYDYHGNGLDFSVAADGGISGSESGYFINDTWYLNGSNSSDISYTSPNGRFYDKYTSSINNYLDGSGGVWSTTAETYRNSSNGDIFYVAGGVISGSETGYVVNGGWAMNLNTFVNDTATLTFFGTTYTSTGYNASRNYNPDGSSVYNTDRVYSNSDGSWYELATSTNDETSTTVSSDGGWDVRAGSFSSLPSWNAFSSPMFAPAQLSVDGSPFIFQAGTHDGTTVTDTYINPDTNDTLTISGIPYDFRVSFSPVAVHWPAASASGTYHVSGAFDLPTHTVLPQSSSRSQPALMSYASLWVDGIEFPFSEGFDDGAGGKVDVYKNDSSGGIMKIYGSSTSGNVYDVILGQSFYENACNNGIFQISGHSIALEATSAELYFPPAIWFRGEVCTKSSGLSAGSFSYSKNGVPFVVTKSGDDYTLSGSDVIVNDDPETEANEEVTATYSGTFQLGTGLQVIHRTDGQGFYACEMAYDTNQTQLILRGPANAPSDGCPPGLTMDQRSWRYVGTFTAEEQSTHYYGSDTGEGDDVSPMLILMSISGNTASVTYRHLATMDGASVGSFDLSTHLIHTSRPSNPPVEGSSGSLPMPTFPADPGTDFKVWEVREPAAELSLPPTFRVGSGVWRFARMDGENAIYEGYYPGQTITVQPAGSNGQRLVDLVDTDLGINTQGTFNSTRQSILMRNGQLVNVFTGDENGTQNITTLNGNNLQTVPGDLDIIGDLLSFGTITGNASLAGTVFQFSDEGQIGTLSSVLSLPQSQWVWSHASTNIDAPPQPAMQLDVNGTLRLFRKPAANLSSDTGVQLNPMGASSFPFGIRVLPQGDLPMNFTSGAQPTSN